MNPWGDTWPAAPLVLADGWQGRAAALTAALDQGAFAGKLAIVLPASEALGLVSYWGLEAERRVSALAVSKSPIVTFAEPTTIGGSRERAAEVSPAVLELYQGARGGIRAVYKHSAIGPASLRVDWPPGGVSIPSIDGLPQLPSTLPAGVDVDAIAAVATQLLGGFGAYAPGGVEGDGVTLALAPLVVAGLTAVGISAVCATAWSVTTLGEQRVILQTKVAEIQAKAQVAGTLATAKIAAGQDVDIKAIVGSVAASEEQRRWAGPLAAAVAGAIVGGVAYHYAHKRAVRS